MKPKKTSDDAKKLTVSLSERVMLALQMIGSARRSNENVRNTRNEIIEDAVWMLFTEGEKLSSETIDAVIPPKPKEPPKKQTVTPIRKK